MILTERHKQLTRDIQSVRMIAEYREAQGQDATAERETIQNLREIQRDLLEAAGYAHARVPVGKDLRNIPETVTRK